MGMYSGGLIIGRIFVSEIWGLYFERAYCRRGLLSEFYGTFFPSSGRVQENLSRLGGEILGFPDDPGQQHSCSVYEGQLGWHGCSVLITDLDPCQLLRQSSCKWQDIQ